MSREKKQEEQKAGAPEWMTTYGDLVTLLMCFFVLLFAFSEIDAQKFEAIMQSFQGSAGVLSGGQALSDAPFVFDAMPENDSTEPREEEEDLQILKEIIEQFIEEENLDFEINVELEDRGLIIRFPDKALFDSGEAEIRTQTVDTLIFLGEVLSSEQFAEMEIRVEGHTDNVPMSSYRYPSNWELSTGRATNVIKFFVANSEIAPYRMSASGYGEYHPIASNDTAEGRQQNRRVDVVVMRKLTSDDAENPTDDNENPE